ncbi:hypothetical protein H0H92_002458 [Tricholoma furcatifolium]|nr:hypothetical protein H0H92_002458 [Tricholoma furcatifolium]
MKFPNPFRPSPAPPSFGKGKILPEHAAPYLSRLVFQWLVPILDVGYSRPMEKDDLWELPPAHLTAAVTDELEEKFYSRCEPGKHLRPMRSDITAVEAESSNNKPELDEKSGAEPERDSKKKPKYDSSLYHALQNTFMFRIWLAGFFKLAADTLKTTTPLLSKVLLTWLTKSYVYYHLSAEEKAAGVMPKPQGIGYGIGLAFGLFAMQGIIFRKSLRISGRAKLEHGVGQITTMISTDATRLDRFTTYGHNLWVAPIQIAIGVGLLVGNVLLLGFPIQVIFVRIMYAQRQKSVGFTDRRLRLTTEGIRLIKFYAWESFYIDQLGMLRTRELKAVKKSAGHDLNVATIFTSLQLFNVIRIPLAFFPFVLSTFTDALVALRRISKFLLAEELEEQFLIDYGRKTAVSVDGDFTWEVAGKPEEKHSQTDAKGRKKGKKSKKSESVLPTSVDPASSSSLGGEDWSEEDKPFELEGLKLKVSKGSFVAIVGRVGSGKSSVLQAMIGEMRKTRGNVKFGGDIAYVPQNAWIQNATLRENVLFGQEDDEKRFRDVIRACSLERDLEVLPNGEQTEIGEKGINLSGGQKARVSLARAAYSPSDIVLLDDPLSAVDAYVGQAILEQCILNGPLANRTRILVTHALHVLDKTDYIYVMDNGVIAEHGTYDSLMSNSVLFSRLMEEYGRLEHDSDDEDGVGEESRVDSDDKGQHSKKPEAALMQTEERVTGSVSWKIYADYLRAAGGLIWAPFLVFLLTLSQGSQVANNIFLGFWTETSIHNFRQGDYMAVYAGIGVAQAFLYFAVSFALAYLGLISSLNLFKAALTHVLRSPISFFDTNPVGRILSRLSKDQDTLDTEISIVLWQFLSTFSSVLGTVALVFYTFPYLGLIFVPMIFLYWIISAYYRRTSVETKRLDSLMRSKLYGSYSETLTGLATIRAYGAQNKAVRDADAGLDLENRAYYMTISIQRWLSVRLDMFGNTLVLGIALFAAGFRHSVNPSKIGVVLSYTLSITQVFSDMIAQFAQNEQNMNAVERVLHYAELPSEGDATTPNDPSLSWPSQGQISFKGVKMAYRKGLPLVLKGVTFDIKPGEKVGIVGRTGAGKSSLLQALLRIVELEDGKIEIDGHDIRSMGLDTLRSRLALVPQDTSLFLGTLRENIDPQRLRTDAELISLLQRAWLLPSDGSSDPVAEAKFSLDSTVGDEGSNFSVGEKQLLALCRALVKNSRIIILDEATSSVDMETDAKLQKTIQREFATSTLLCIAHRLNTIAYYDRVLVMDAGEVAEFDTVLNLYDNEHSIFRSLCNEANLQRADILRIRADHEETVGTIPTGGR